MWRAPGYFALHPIWSFIEERVAETYRYRENVAFEDPRASHLGFIIEDMPQGSPAVMSSRERVDLYGYLSMAVASLQQQEREIRELKVEIARLGRSKK